MASFKDKLRSKIKQSTVRGRFGQVDTQPIVSPFMNMRKEINYAVEKYIAQFRTQIMAAIMNELDVPKLLQREKKVLSAFKQEVTPVKNKDYRDGINGLDGEEGRPGLNGRDGRDGIDGKNPDPTELVPFIEAMMPKIPELQPDMLVEKINNANATKISQSKIAGLSEEFMKLVRMIREVQRPTRQFVGSGDSVTAGSNITITKVGGRKEIASTSSGFTKLTATGSVNGVNTDFTLVSEPSWVIIDGVWSEATNPDASVNWTWTAGTLTLSVSIPPNKSIVGIA